jgi:hypothetical protein
MTEGEWLMTGDIGAMLDYVALGSDRKLRQFACECLLRSWQQPSWDRHVRVVEVYQLYLDGNATPTEWFEVYSDAGGIELGGSLQDLISTEPLESARRIAGLSRGLQMRWDGIRPEPIGPSDDASILREVFGNPFRSVTFDPAWRTSTVLALAQGIYDDKVFDRLPILADALQDAGCDNDDILCHLRDATAPHVRGCWALDLVLGKE